MKNKKVSPVGYHIKGSTQGFESINKFLQYVQDYGIDPNQRIYLSGKAQNEKIIDLIQF